MLEKPDLPDERLISCLHDGYGLPVARIDFLPLGADRDTAVYRVAAGDGMSYFLKLRRGAVFEPSVAIPRLLSDQGIAQVIAPLLTCGGQLWSRLDTYTVILYPFVVGHNGLDPVLTNSQWVDLGAALNRIHSTVVPDAVRQSIPEEDYGPRWNDRVREFQVQVATASFDDPVAARLAAFLHSHRADISQLVERAEQLSRELRTQPPTQALCHADLHAWNVLIEASDALYIVDWDTLIFAPKERDLMFIGGGVGGIWNTARDEALFYQGYGPTQIDHLALVYFRYERIVEDIAVFCEELLETDAGGADRAKGLRSVIGQFLPNEVIDIARRSDALLLPAP